MVTALTDKYLAPLAEELAEAGTPIETLTANATKEDERNRTVATTIDRFGHVDVLVNTLGDAVSKPVVPRPDQETDQPFTEDDWNFIIDVNVKGVFLGCKAVGPHFLSAAGTRSLTSAPGSFAGTYRAMSCGRRRRRLCTS